MDSPPVAAGNDEQKCAAGFNEWMRANEEFELTIRSSLLGLSGWGGTGKGAAMNGQESPREKRENDLKKADDNRKQFEDTVRRMRARLDRTSPRSSSRHALEEALKKLISRGPTLFDELNADEDDDE